MKQPEAIRYRGKLYKFTGQYFGTTKDWPFFRCGKHVIVWRLEKGYPACVFVHEEM